MQGQGTTGRMPGVDYEETVGRPVDDASFAQVLADRLASSIAEATQLRDGGPKPLPVAEIQRRQAAREEVDQLIAQYEEERSMPRYRLTEDFFSPADELIPKTYISPVTRQEVPTVIDFPGVPNEHMVPLNDPAQKIHAAFMRSIGGATPDLADTSMEAYLNRPGRVRMIDETGNAIQSTPPMVAQREKQVTATATVVVDEGANAVPVSSTRVFPGGISEQPSRI